MDLSVLYAHEAVMNTTPPDLNPTPTIVREAVGHVEVTLAPGEYAIATIYGKRWASATDITVGGRNLSSILRHDVVTRSVRRPRSVR
jgi:hypothetical protein